MIQYQHCMDIVCYIIWKMSFDVEQFVGRMTSTG